MQIHGIGPGTMYKIAELLEANGFDDVITETPDIKVKNTNGEADTLAVTISGTDYLVEYIREEDGAAITGVYKSVKVNNGVIKELDKIVNG